ncbi:tRNA adenosine(34) deaminase TadA [Vagococcus sp.]|uniref:tRNA adenosine(34) deaminase TadA n=1 Tax=Vagococcus sp. TaxID=1933889 RepID=UPI003F9E51CD
MEKFSNQEKEYYMREAILEAKKAATIAEVPIGAVIVFEGNIIGRGHNVRELSQDATTHAEILAIKAANRSLKSWRLEGAALFVTLEPCPMCSGAILNSRIPQVYYGAKDPKAGACDSLYHLLDDERLNHRCEVESGVLEEETATLLTDFFKELRAKKKLMKKKTSNS